MVTIKDVAKRAGVSVATVSRVINNQNSVSLETRERVSRSIAELRYEPNLLGRTLRRSKTQKILVVLPTISNPFYSRLVRGIETKACEYGFNIMMCTTHSELQHEVKYLDLLRTRLVDGAIFLSSELDAAAMDDLASSFPVVQCSEYIKGTDTQVVSIDNEQAAFDAVGYLCSLGHRRIALATSQKSYYSAVLREEGYLRALRERNIVPEPELTVRDSYSYHAGQRCAERLLAMKNPPTAVFAVADSIAIGVLKTLTDQGRAGDFSVFGFDNTSICEMLSPALSTVSQPREEMGKIAMDMLHEKILAIDCENKTVMLAHKLVERESARRIDKGR